ncbi:hypothetical protein QUA71_23800 [Microcoleus sp. MON1_C5]|uniref:hypothetical protein n=1 Tax=Microcoleus sp. MON1_C5 TaxID=2818828 RepID=UPI002FD70820
MKLNSEPGLVVLGSRINSDSRCKDAEVFSLSSIAIASRSGRNHQNCKTFHFLGKVRFTVALSILFGSLTANTVLTAIDGYKTNLKLAYYSSKTSGSHQKMVSYTYR